MKKGLILSIIICILLIFIKYYISDYELQYNIDNYQIKTNYNNRRLYYEIKNTKNNYVYNFDVYKKRGIKKDIIKKIQVIEDENINCIYPTIENINTYPLCYYKEEFVDYNLINSDLLAEYKKIPKEFDRSGKDFAYNNNLNDNEYIALWNYKGYIVMNKDNYKYVEIFDKDKYDNSLAYIIDNKIYMADNNQEHEFNKIYSLDLKDNSIDSFDLEYNIDYDSYIVGNIGNNLYIFDNKYSILYEINVKKEKVSIIGSNEKGYVKYENNKFVSCSKSEYKINKITINNNNSIYSYKIDNSVYKNINDNNYIIQKIIDSDVNILKEKENTIYYQYEDNVYKYSPSNGSEKIFYNYELKFNSNNTIFIYIK